MPSSPLLRLNLQDVGTNISTWGAILNGQVFQRLEESVAGWSEITVPAAGYTLTTANFSADEGRMAMLRLTGAGGPLTIPAVSKRYDIWNACTGDCTVTNGSASVTVKAGEVVAVISNGGARVARVQPTDFGGASLTSVARVSGLSAPTASNDAATKAYVDATAFGMTGGSFPGQTGNARHFLTTNGTAAGWGTALTPTALAADQNDYNPTGLSDAGVLRLAGTAARNITGLATGSDGGFLVVENVGSFALTFVDSSSSSLAANRLSLGGQNRVLLPGKCLWLIYDGATSAWRDISPLFFAAGPDILTATDVSKALTAKALADSAAFGTVPYAATIAYDVRTYGYNVACTLTGNATLGQISGLFDGETLTFDPIQDATGSRLLSYNATYHDFMAVGTPTLSTAAAKRDSLIGQYKSATGKIYWSFQKAA